MNEDTLINKPCKYDRVDILTKVHCTWLYPMFIRGLRRDIQMRDLYRCPDADRCEKLVQQFENNWNQELKKKSPSFTRASLKTFLPSFLAPFMFNLIGECVLDTSKVIFLGYVLRYFADPANQDFTIACYMAGALVAISLVYVSFLHPAMYLAVRVAIKVRVCWCTLMYKKSLKLKHSAFGKTTIGQILNLMSNDVSRLDEYCMVTSYLIVGPIQTVIGMFICWQYIGWVSLIGLAILMGFIPFNSFMGRMFLKIRRKVAALSDNRIRLMNEIIKGMRVIKMYAWERHFDRIISEARRKEISQIRNSTFLKALNSCIAMISPRAIIFTILIVHVLRTGHLGAETLFVTMFIFDGLRFTMTSGFPQSIALAAELYVSCKRIQKYLLLEEIDDKKYITPSADPSSGDMDVTVPLMGDQTNGKQLHVQPRNDCSVWVHNMSAAWDPELKNPTLKQISIELAPGELLAVIGPVGSGKSSFLMSLLDEIEVIGGQVSVQGSMAYASQESWSFNSSIVENITFGKSYDGQRFQEVIGVCAMKRDLKLFPFAEKTLVGERGVMLSGGQKARITLARALYNDADVYLLDDPLSAVDTEVANHIFDKCITQYLAKKTVILVTHQIQFIQKASKILVLKEGRPLAVGSYDQLMNSGIDFMSLIKEEKPEPMAKDSEEQSVAMPAVATIVDQFRNRTISVVSVRSEAEEVFSDQKVDDENKAIGGINSRVYWDYITAGAGPVLFVVGLLSTLVSQGLQHYTDIWLSEWTNKEDSIDGRQDTDERHNVMIYCILIASIFGALLLRSGTWFVMCMKASVNLHNRIFYRLMRTPIAFFDNNPVGRILNRFTKDLGVIDEQLPVVSYDVNLIFTQIIGSVIVVALINPYLIIPAIFLLILIYIIRRLYLKTGRDLKRFEGMARSPIYNHMTITLSGLATIRAFKAQELFRQQYYRYQNDHTSTYFLCVSASRCLGITMDWMCNLYVLCVALFLMIFNEGLRSGDAGLAITMALGLTGMSQWGVRQSAELENQMTSVERIVEYSRLESEPELESAVRPPAEWPQTGRIELQRVYLTYNNAPKPTLIDLNCVVNGGEKVGIVGRTGAGKSSILSALFRMHDIDGQIIIDGIDYTTIGLHDLRRAMSIIPQDPIAFIGSLRKNLDPFDEHSEERIWEVLEEVQLKQAVREMSGQLEYQLSESGANLSVGQRQLICLARAILRRNRILVLDEATANVDHKTDALIQRTIRHNFADCTVLTVAHRLHTIIDSDRVLVLDAGRIVEFGRPYELLQDSSGVFHKLVQQTGQQMASQLTRAAKQAYDSCHKVITI